MQDYFGTDHDTSGVKFYELNGGNFDDEIELPEAPEAWGLEDFDDVVGQFDDFSF